ncbi:LamG-like jellyroll fold domain-containing protein [Reichenbachiella sp.]|uniref:LamG-like jellyroll fold domain-containing protein n=1 Tax=Reichenbachiella sp. TaxID=2184521 RepID=UPI003B5A69D5
MKIFGALTLIILVCSTKLLGQVDFKSSLIGNWCLDNNALDNSELSYHGIISGAKSTPDRHGINDAAFEFDGIDDEIIINHSFEELSLPFTISAWVYKHSATKINHIFTSCSQPSSYTGIYFSIYSDQGLRISYGDGGPAGSFSRRTKISSEKVPLETWVHVMAVVKGPYDMSLYINCEDAGGYYDGSGGNIEHSSEPARIGRATHETFYYGKVDDLRIYNRSLNVDEINLLCEIESCEADVCFTAPPEINSPVNICSTDLNNTEIIIEGEDLTWYDDLSLSRIANTGNSFFPTTGATYYITQNIDECESQPATLEIIDVNPPSPPVPNFSVLSVCPGSSIDLSITGSNIKWYDNNHLTSIIPPANYLVNTEKTLYATQTVDGCTSLPSELQLKLERPIKPAPLFEGDILCLGSEVSVSGEKIIWYDEEFNVISKESNKLITNHIGLQKYFVTQTLDECESEFLEIEIQVQELNHEEIFIPNAISPNNDNINDSFYWISIKGEICLGNFRQITIIDRRGQEIFSGKNIDFQWKPIDESQGIHYYFIEFDSAIFKGNIQIIK